MYGSAPPPRDWKTRSQTKALCRKGKFTQRWLVELDLIFRQASQSPPWNGLPSAPLTKRGLPSLLVPQTSFRGGGGGPRGNQWCRREIPCGDEAGDFYRHRQTLVARGQALQLWKNARVSLSSPIAPGSGVTSRDCPNLRGSQVTTPPTGELACMLIPTLILWYFVSHGY